MGFRATRGEVTEYSVHGEVNEIREVCKQEKIDTRETAERIRGKRIFFPAIRKVN